MQQDSFCQAPSVLSKKIGRVSSDYVHPIGDKGWTGAEPHEDEDDKDVPHRNECGYLGQANIYCRYEDGRYSQKKPQKRIVVKGSKAQRCEWYGNQIDEREI